MEYRKKQVTVEAIQWSNKETLDDIDKMDSRGRVIHLSDKLIIQTPEGRIVADLGNWIIKDKNGEISACKPGAFAAEYEADNFDIDHAGEYSSQLCAALGSRPDLLGGLFMQIESILRECEKSIGYFKICKENIPLFLAMLDAINYRSGEIFSSVDSHRKEYERQLKILQEEM